MKPVPDFVALTSEIEVAWYNVTILNDKASTILIPHFRRQHGSDNFFSIQLDAQLSYAKSWVLNTLPAAACFS